MYPLRTQQLDSQERHNNLSGRSMKRKNRIFHTGYNHTIVSVLLLLAVTELIQSSDAFGLQHLHISRRQANLAQYRHFTGPLFAKIGGGNSTDAWLPSAAPTTSRRRDSPFKVRKRVRKLTRLFAQNDNGESNDSWSRSAATATSRRRDSPLKVRKRVRAVLEKARSRTGVQNGSTSADDSRQAQSVIAETASIGGLGDGSADIIVQVATNGTSSSPRQATGAVNTASATANGMSNNGYKPLTEEQLDLQKNGSTGDKNGATEPASSSTTTTASTSSSSASPRKSKDFDVIRGDVPAAAEYMDPLPFPLPKLSDEQRKQLRSGERIQEQSRMGREGSGYVVLDVKAPPFVVWETLLDFEAYPETIPTVKSMQLYTSEKLNVGFVNEKPVNPGTGREARHYGTPSVTRAAFTLSKFRLNIAAIHRYTPHPLGDYMIFTLDKSCTNMVLKGAKGIWYTEENPDGRKVRKGVVCCVLRGFHCLDVSISDAFLLSL